MKTSIFTLLLFFSCVQWLAAQCPPGDITFSTQGQLDSFPLNHPDCTDIPGKVTVSGEDVFSLEPLNNLSHIAGSFTIQNNPALVDLTGLENLDSVGSLVIVENASLESLKGLDGLIRIRVFTEADNFFKSQTGLSIQENPVLASLSGLQNLEVVEGCVLIEQNPLLTNLSGLNMLSTIGKCSYAAGFDYRESGLRILNNAGLLTLDGLDSLESVTACISILDNGHLKSLEGFYHLKNIGVCVSGSDFGEPTIQSLTINNNDSLTLLTGFENIDFLPGRLYVENNTSLASLQGLHHITSIGSHVSVYNNDGLGDFSGLQNVHTIKGSLSINNNQSLTSLSGLENLDSLERCLNIGGNSALTSLSSLQGLQSVGQCFGLRQPPWHLRMINNNLLPSLSGLDSVYFQTNSGFLGKVFLIGCSNLSTCEVQSICLFIEDGGVLEVSDNAVGCANLSEIEAACETTPVEDLFSEQPCLQLFPNPADDILQMKRSEASRSELFIHDLLGRTVFRKWVDGETSIDVSQLPNGIYSIKVLRDNRQCTELFVKH